VGCSLDSESHAHCPGTDQHQIFADPDRLRHVDLTAFG